MIVFHDCAAPVAGNLNIGPTSFQIGLYINTKLRSDLCFIKRELYGILAEPPVSHAGPFGISCSAHTDTGFRVSTIRPSLMALFAPLVPV